MNYRVIILEDNKIDAQLMKEYLVRSQEPYGDIKLVHCKEEYEQALQTFQPDLILSDYRLVNFNGLDAVELKNQYCRDIPIIIVSATIGEENAVELIKAGAADFLIKNNIQARLAQVSMRAIDEAREKRKRQSAEQNLERTQNRYQMLFNTSLDGILIGLPDEDGRILDANPAFCELLGYTLEEIKQSKRADLIAEPTAKIKEFLAQRRANDRFRGELMMKHKEGHIIPVEINSLIVESENQEKKSFSIFRDIRSRKEAEERERWQNEVMSLEKDLGKILNDNINFDEALEKCLDRILTFLGWDIGHLYIRDFLGEEDLFRSTNIWSKHTSKNLESFITGTIQKTFGIQEGDIGMVAENQKPHWFQISAGSAGQNKRFDAAKASGIKTGLMLPVLLNDETEAVLEFYTTTSAKKNEDLESVLQRISIQISRLLERKRNFQALKEEKDRYRLITQNSTDVISRTDPQGIILYSSPSARLMGYDPEELLNTSAYEYFHPDDLEKIETSHQQITTIKEPYTIEYRIRQKDGAWRWVESVSKPILDPGTGEVLEIQISTRDISDRKKYEQELRKHLQLNEKVINSLPGIFFMISKDGEVKRVNQKLRDFFPAADGDDQFHFEDFVSPEDLTKARDSFRKVFKEGIDQIELNIITEEGRQIPYLMTGIADNVNDKPYLIGTGINIEARLKAEQELAREKRFVERAINSLPGLFYVLDENQNYVRYNENLIDSLGYTKEEIMQMNPLDFYLEEDHERVTQAIGKAFKKGQATLISRLKTKSGKTPYYFITGSHFREEGKDYILGTGVDITEQIKLEELLNQTQHIAQIGAWELNPETGEVNWTDVTRQIFEADDSYEPNLEGGLNFFIGESRNKVLSAVDEAMANGTAYDLELEIKTAKGNRRWVRTIGNAEFRDGKCMRLYGSLQDIHDKKIAEENLKQSLREKEILLMEIHHRVKNNLALISSFMQLQSFQTDNETVYRYLSDSQSRIKSIAIIHEHLYENQNLSSINLKENIVKLTEHIDHSLGMEKEIEFSLDLEEMKININQAVPFALIVNELLTNCYKHAFKEMQTGTIHVSTKTTRDNTVVLTVRDNGAGLPENFTLKNPDTLGMTILTTLCKQLEGDLSFKSEGSGTTFILMFTRLEKVKGSSSSFLS